MPLKLSDLTVGDVYSEEVCNNLSRTQIVQYAGTSGDYNPLHSDEIFTTQIAGYPSVFAHGMLTMGMTGRVVTNLFGAENVKKYGVRFTNQVWPGDDLTGKAVIEAIREEGGQTLVDLAITTTNQKGDVVVMGNATGRVDA